MDCLKESASEIKNKMNAMEKALVDHKAQLNALVSEIKDQVFLEIDKLFKNIESFSEQLVQFSNRMDFLERDRIASDMLISGVPTVNDFDARELFTKICSAIGFVELNSARNVFRPHNLQNGAKKSSSIIVRFSSTRLKSMFFARYKSFKTLKLSDIGIDLETRIYCNDLLTKNNSAIFRTARQLQRSKNILKTFTKRGRIFVMDNNQNTTLVTNCNELNVYKNTNTYSHKADGFTGNVIDDVIVCQTINGNSSSVTTPIAKRTRIRSKTGSTTDKQ